MFFLKHQLGEDIRSVRKELKLTKEKLARLSRINVKTLRLLENGKRIGKIETFLKIKNALQKNFNFDLAERAGIKIIWALEDLNSEGLNIIKGGLLGDGCVTKSGTYQQEAKDKKYLGWLGELLNKVGIKYKVIPTNHKDSYSKNKNYYCLYSHSCPAFYEFRKRWYIEGKNRGIKRIPPDLKLAPTTLLHLYLGDGDLKHDKRIGKRGGRPSVRLSLNDFSKEDIELLIKNFKRDFNLDFYSSPKLNKNIKKGYILHLYTKDLFKFFNIIGQKPPTEIENSLTKEFEGGRICTFKDKWPDKQDWIKILAKTKGMGKLLKERRKELALTQRGVAEKVGLKKHHISEIECGRKQMSLNCFNKILLMLTLDISKLLDTLFTQNETI